MSNIRVLHILHSMNAGGIESFLMNVYRNIDRTEIQFDFPNFYLLDKKVSKAQALFYLTNLTKEQMTSVIQSLYHYVYDEETKVKKIIPFPNKIAK